MQISAGTTPAKRTRAKASDSSPTSTAPKKSRRKATGAAVASETQIEIVTMQAVPEPGTEDLTGLIATTAYFIAAERNFASGHELDDWLEAERRIKSA
jgi:hypothetical protein